jgi:hypothetical protein
LYSGVDSAFAPHLELPGLPLVNQASAPPRVGAPQRLTAVDAVTGTPAASLNSALNRAGLTPWPSWSPGGDAVAIPLDGDLVGSRRELWLFSLSGNEAVRLAGDIWAAQWAPNGRWVAYVENAAAVLHVWFWQIAPASDTGRSPRRRASTPGPPAPLGCTSPATTVCPCWPMMPLTAPSRRS